MRIGTGSSKIGDKILPNFTCKYCGKTDTTRIVVHGKFFRMGLPYFPIGKEAVTECQSCRKVHRLEEFDESLRAAYDPSEYKTPWWNWSGLALMGIPIMLIVLLMAISIISNWLK